MKKTFVFFIFTCLTCIFLFTCKDDDAIPDRPKFEQEFPIVFNASIPADKLPWPHHNPTLSQSEYESLIEDIFIINNFGQYQCADTKESCYFHDGLDIILDNGTPIFAVEAGVVKANIGGDEFYRTLIVENMGQPGVGWGYTHINSFEVNVLDTVEQGQFLGRVNFQGLEHIHFSKVRRAEGGQWNNFNDHITSYPDDLFIFNDNDAPIIEVPFLFYENNTDNRFEHGSIDTVSGEVDIVVRMRDPGKYANDNLGGTIWGNRLCVKTIDYRILKNGEELIARPSFDFSKMEFSFSQERWKELATVYKHHLVADPDHVDFNAFFSNYIITNARDSLMGQVNPEDAELAWNTLEISDLGQPVFPDGKYEIEISATDSHGNFALAIDSVFVKNE